MIVYFADRELNIIGHASTGLPEGMRIQRDELTDEIDSGTVSFEFDLAYRDRLAAEDMTAVGNYIFRQVDGEARLFTILDTELQTKSGLISVYAEDAGLDLLGEICEAYTATAAHTIQWYINEFTQGSGFTIGINEIPTLMRTLEWTGESTVTERLLSLATQFEAEISYSFVIDGMSVTEMHINVFKKRGKDVGVELRLTRDISNITIKRSAANIATALKVTGAVPSGKKAPVTLKGQTYDDGDFFIESATGILKSRKAWNTWHRKLATGDGHIVKTFTYQTTNVTELRNRAIAQLTKLRDAEVNYDIDLVKLPENVACGDTVRIVDDAGELYLSARILKLEVSEADGTHKAVLGDYVMLDSGISEIMRELSEKVSSLEQETLGAAVITEMTAVNYDAGTATIKATLRINGEIATPTSYAWTKNDDPTVIGTSQTLNVTDIEAVYHCTCTW